MHAKWKELMGQVRFYPVCGAEKGHFLLSIVLLLLLLG